MDQGKQYGQANMNLPHDVVPLPSQGIFYTNKKKSLKVGYLTAQDENLLLSNSGNNNLVMTLLKNKIYEPDFNVNELLDGDAEAILIFLSFLHIFYLYYPILFIFLINFIII